MTSINLALEDELAALLRERHQSLERSAREFIVLELYRRGTISSGKAAKCLNMTRWDLVQYASEVGGPLFDMTADESKAEREIALGLTQEASLSSSRHTRPRPPYREPGERWLIQDTGESAGVEQGSGSSAGPRYVVGLSAVASHVSCRRCSAVLEPGTAMRVFDNLAPICDRCAWEWAPELAALLKAGAACGD